jgi:hypothetical protein
VNAVGSTLRVDQTSFGNFRHASSRASWLRLGDLNDAALGWFGPARRNVQHPPFFPLGLLLDIQLTAPRLPTGFVQLVRSKRALEDGRNTRGGRSCSSAESVAATRGGVVLCNVFEFVERCDDSCWVV